jgi:tripartite ATP-independent transporter DctM subunit
VASTSIVLLAIPVVLLFVLLLAGVPITYTLFISGSVGLFIVESWAFNISMFQNVAYSSTADFLLSPIFTFILMAEFLRQGGIIRDVFTSARNWLSAIPGGLAIATTLANGMMAAMSGSSVASAATMAKISVPEMRNAGYDDRLSLGTVSAAGTFAAMIPPSLGLIIYGVMTQQSITVLFIAGVVPGLITVIGYVAVISAWTKYEPEIAGEDESYTWSERFGSLRNIWASILIIALVLGGLYGGIFTPSEAGAVGAIGAFLIALREMNWDGFTEALWSTTRTATVVILIVFPAKVFGRYLTLTGITQSVITSVSESTLPALAILVVILVIYIALGMMMDQLAILILTLPLTFPLITTGLGYDPIWFGILLVKTIEIGLVTPPFGLNIFVVSGSIDSDISTTYRGALRFLAVDFVVLGLLIFFPVIANWLPSLM